MHSGNRCEREQHIRAGREKGEREAEIILHLRDCCIETAAKRRYELLVSELIKEENEEKEKELELLLEFLKKADFKELRMLGFEGRMVVAVRKEGQRFVVEKRD